MARAKKQKSLDQGHWAVIEGGKIVLYDVERNKYGVARVDRLPTTVSASSSNVSPDVFPVKVEHSYSGTHLIVPSAGGGLPRKVPVKEEQLDRSHASREKTALDESELSASESDERWRHILMHLRDNNRLAVVAVVKKLPRGAKDMFEVFAEALRQGGSEEDASDRLYEKFGVDAANDFLRSVRLYKGGKSSLAGNVFVLEGRGGRPTPTAAHGEMEEIDFSALPS